MVTPYGAFPVILANYSVGLAWYHNMLKGPKMQGQYLNYFFFDTWRHFWHLLPLKGPLGSTEGINNIGTEISPVTTWDTKITTVATLVRLDLDLLSFQLNSNMFFFLVGRHYWHHGRANEDWRHI